MRIRMKGDGVWRNIVAIGVDPEAMWRGKWRSGKFCSILTTNRSLQFFGSAISGKQDHRNSDLDLTDEIKRSRCILFLFGEKEMELL